MSADTTDAVAEKLKGMRYTPILIEPASRRITPDGIFNWFQGVSLSELNFLTRQLYVLQKAGIPIQLSLQSLEKQTSKEVLKQVLTQISRSIEQGKTFAEALEEHPKIFNRLYVGMIRVGETSGSFSDILERLALLGEHEVSIQTRVRTALRYPVFVLIAITLAFCFLVTVVIPRFAEIYAQSSVTLPLPTRILLGVHSGISRYGWIFLVCAGFLFFLRRDLFYSKRWRQRWDRLLLKVPVWGSLLLKLEISRFGRMCGILMRSGVPILSILELVSSSVTNTTIARALDQIKEGVNKGKGMTEPMKQTRLFPPVVLQMVAIGEETGKLDELLLFISDYYELQIDQTMGTLVSLIEPFLILILGIAVSVLAVGVLSPMWGLMNVWRG